MLRTFVTLRSVETKECSKCKNVFSIEDFHLKSKKTGKRSSHCKKCQNAYCKAHYNQNKQYYKDKAIRNGRTYAGYVNSLKKKPCLDCKQTFHPCQMDFDHVRDKVESISVAVLNGWSKPRLDSEIAKCDLVCSNCHRLRTWQRRQPVS